MPFDCDPGVPDPVVFSLASRVSSARYFGVQFCLEDLFGYAINLVTEKALRAQQRPLIEGEAVHV